jgi:hypothetical protein
MEYEYEYEQETDISVCGSEFDESEIEDDW